VPRLTAIVPATDSPPTLAACLEGIESAAEPPEELVVVREGGIPSAARNDGAEDASGDVLVFVDADVVPHADAFVRIRRAFADDPDLVALFGSYDDSPAAPGAVSAFRNLLHHHVHQTSAGQATTFWTGLGAVRREAFFGVGGFDAEQRWLEDVDLGMRLSAGGARIVLDPSVQGTHLKRWGLVEMIRTDFARRGIPWVGLMLRHGGASSELNLAWRHRASGAVSVVAAVAVLGRRLRLAVAALAALVALNGPFYRLLLRRRGPAEAALGVLLHAVHHVAGAVAVPVGVLAHWRRRA
jgi:cellulose synthase/poly-beta-1,6-N-acetylglucosamine synthase-like glycosyltransferase